MLSTRALIIVYGVYVSCFLSTHSADDVLPVKSET